MLGALFLYIMWAGAYGPEWLRHLIIAVAVCVAVRAWCCVLTKSANPAYQQALESNEKDQCAFHAFVLAMDEARYWALCDQVLPEDFESYLFDIYEQEAKPSGTRYAGKPSPTVSHKGRSL